MLTTTGIERIEVLPYQFKNSVKDRRHKELWGKMAGLNELPTDDEVWSVVQEMGERDVFNTEGSQYNFAQVCHYLGFYLIPTVEFVGALAEIISDLQIGGPVVEIAAGNGKLSHSLRREGVEVHPTDKYRGSGEVEQLDSTAALRKYHPKLVISAWVGNYETVKATKSNQDLCYISIGGSRHNGILPSLSRSPHTKLVTLEEHVNGWQDVYRYHGLEGVRIRNTQIFMFGHSNTISK